MDDIIIVDGVTKSYKGLIVLDHIQVSFERAKIHGIIGRNGSGKTVLIKTICGFVLPDKGQVIVDGKTIGKDIDFPQNVGAIIEAPGFIPTLSAYKNLSYLASLRGIIGAEEIRRAISVVGLNPDDKKHVGKFSLGMKQRLGLAQAIMENPDILILDEPMNGLDKDGVVEMRNLLNQFRINGKTIILVSHSAEDINILCDTVYEMDKGILHKVEKQNINSR